MQHWPLLNLHEGVVLPNSHYGMLGANGRRQECHYVLRSIVEQSPESLHLGSGCHEGKGSIGLFHGEE